MSAAVQTNSGLIRVERPSKEQGGLIFVSRSSTTYTLNQQQAQELGQALIEAANATR